MQIWINWSARKKKEAIFNTVYFVQRNFFNIWFLSQCTVHRVKVQNIILLHIKKLYFIHFFASFLLAFSTRPKKHCQLYFINWLYKLTSSIDKISIFHKFRELKIRIFLTINFCKSVIEIFRENKQLELHSQIHLWTKFSSV